MEENLAQKSVNLALQFNWKEAIKINQEILKKEPEDIDALNRLAKAYFENGDPIKAKATSKKVLKINPNNNIARNSLNKFKQKPTKKNHSKTVSFIEEPGKTKITMLINLGSEKVYSCLNAGDEVSLVTHAHKVSVTTTNNKYIGKLTDDLSARMRILIKGGKKFQTYVKSIGKNQVKIFIKSDSICFSVDKSEPFSEFGSQLDR